MDANAAAQAYDTRYDAGLRQLVDTRSRDGQQGSRFRWAQEESVGHWRRPSRTAPHLNAASARGVASPRSHRLMAALEAPVARATSRREIPASWRIAEAAPVRARRRT